MIWKANMADSVSIWTTFAPETLRERRIRSGISGVLARVWRTKNAASMASDTAPRPSVRPASQPYSSILTTV
jgi:hypothetical protein